jgi:hypothetical protein
LKNKFSSDLKTSSFPQNLGALMINSALDPNWHGNSCNMQEYLPNYDDKVYAIRRKIVTGTMAVLQEHWIDFKWNMPPIHYYKTLTHLIYLWRTPSHDEMLLVNRYIVVNDKNLATIPWEPPTVSELEKAPTKPKKVRAPRKARNTRKRNLQEFFE